MSFLPGTPSDQVDEVSAIGRCVVSHVYISMSARDPEGRDAEYLCWHCFDHRPEQYRLDSLRGSLRLVSTPECRAARAASDPPYDGVDHVMTYLFSDLSDMKGFSDLAVALGGAGRIPFLLPSIERGLFTLDSAVAAPRVKIGADVLAWSPLSGIYLIVERGAPIEEAAARDLVDVPGVAGVWWGRGINLDPSFEAAEAGPMSALEGFEVTYCFLDDDPVATAARLAEVVPKRWVGSDRAGLLAAPYFLVTGHDYDRHLP